MIVDRLPRFAGLMDALSRGELISCTCVCSACGTRTRSIAVCCTLGTHRCSPHPLALTAALLYFLHCAACLCTAERRAGVCGSGWVCQPPQCRCWQCAAAGLCRGCQEAAQLHGLPAGVAAGGCLEHSNLNLHALCQVTARCTALKQNCIM